MDRRFVVMFPSGYDGTRPYPLIFGFHGATRTHLDCRDKDCGGLQKNLGEHAVTVYMKSFSERWRDEGAGFDNNLPFFDAVMATMKREHCLDESRVVVAGTSSGAAFANHLACVRGDQLLAVVAVGGRLSDERRCQRPLAALVMHGVDDSHVKFNEGEAARDAYRARNACSDETIPPIADAHRAVRTERDAGQATYRCVDYRGCADARPVTWCEHGEGGWDNSTHAWPTFGGQLIRAFLAKVP